MSKFFSIVLVFMLYFIVWGGGVSADHTLPVYDVSELSQYGQQYVGMVLGDYGDANSELTMPLTDVFKYPTIIASNNFGYFLYEYVPQFGYSRVSLGKGVMPFLYQTGWHMKVWFFPFGFDREYSVRGVYVIVFGQSLNPDAGLYKYDFSVVSNSKSLVISDVNVFGSSPVLGVDISPSQVDKLLDRMPSVSVLKSNYKKAYNRLVMDYRDAVSAKDYDKVNKIVFSYYYYVKPVYYLVYTVARPYVFVVVQVDDYHIHTKYGDYTGVVNFVVPVYSKNYVIYYKMVRGYDSYNDYLLLGCDGNVNYSW